MTDQASLAPVQAVSNALSDVVASAAPAVVSVHSHRSRSSGFAWRQGLIVTADESLADDGEVSVRLPSGQSVPAKIAGRDPTTDIALLRAEAAELTTANLDTPAVAVGALALAVGATDDGTTAALGIVSRVGGPWRSLRGGEINARLELSLPLEHRAEGGLALDAAGRAFGMVVFGPHRRVLVIPSATIARVAARLESQGRIPRGYLGLGLQSVTLEGSDEAGAIVVAVDPQGPGARAGIHQGDIIVSWSGEPIRHLHALLRALGPDSVGQTVAAGLRRAGESRQVSLTIGERPD
jgi:S1-C subfamily serine protease